MHVWDSTSLEKRQGVIGFHAELVPKRSESNNASRIKPLQL